MARTATLAPLFNINFYLTGAWGEPRSGHIHAGVDLSTGLRSPVRAMYDGTVIFVDGAGTTGSGYGPYIIIKSDDGYAWLYGDLEPFSGFSVGQRVNFGTQISREGNPGSTASTGYHVHVEAEYLGESNTYRYGFANSVNPCPFMGLDNVVNYSNPWYYDGTVPPEPILPSINRRHFPWVLYARKIRDRR